MVDLDPEKFFGRVNHDVLMTRVARRTIPRTLAIMRTMAATCPLQRDLPEPARPAVEIVRQLTTAGHHALLAGGCVRDLLLGHDPQDYDVATDAPPDTVCQLFRKTRKVGVQFGVVLVKQRRRWVEVATFRSDGPYLDGRRPASVTLADARHDAARRDFTVNGMFLNPLKMEVIDYVDGRRDLETRVIRAIGEPLRRFEEDYLRLLRAVRFAARLGFAIESTTLAAIRQHAPRLERVAAERVREELEKMLAHPTRARAWTLLQECGLLSHLWPGATWDAQHVRNVDRLLPRLAADASFELTLALFLLDRDSSVVDEIARTLTLSNDEREKIVWLVQHQAALDDPSSPSVAQLKRLMAGPAFDDLHRLAAARYRDITNGDARQRVLEERIAAIPSDQIQPPPFVTGADLMDRNIPTGPRYKRILDELYTRQLDEVLSNRNAALRALDRLLSGQGDQPDGPRS